MCSEHMSRVVVVGFRPHCDCPETVLNTWPAHDMATLSSISAISSVFLPNWMLMESWCHWVAIDVRICWRCLFYMMHYLKVCFHMTFPFLKGWDITLDFSLDLLSHENLHSFIPSNGMEILFSRIDSSSHTAVSCDLASYCLCLYTVLYLLIYFLVLVFFLLLLLLVLYFQISHLEPFFTDTVFRFSFHDSVSGFRIAGLVLVLKAVVKFYFLWV